MDGFIGAWTPWLSITDYEVYRSETARHPGWFMRLKFEAYFASMLTAGTFPC